MFSAPFFYQTRCFFITHQSCETAHLNFRPFVSSLISACVCFCHSSVLAFRARACWSLVALIGPSLPFGSRNRQLHVHRAGSFWIKLAPVFLHDVVVFEVFFKMFSFPYVCTSMLRWLNSPRCSHLEIWTLYIPTPRMNSVFHRRAV